MFQFLVGLVIPIYRELQCNIFKAVHQNLSCLGTSMRTDDLLMELGFKLTSPKRPGQHSKYRCRIGDFMLTARLLEGYGCNSEFRFSGVELPGREACIADFYLPVEVESYQQGVAQVVLNVPEPIFHLEIPPWFADRDQLEKHLPPNWVPGHRANHLECSVEADWFRLATDDERFAVSFQDKVLKVELTNELLVLPGSGDAWPKVYTFKTSSLKGLPRKISPHGATLTMAGKRLAIGNRLIRCESSQAIPQRLPPSITDFVKAMDSPLTGLKMLFEISDGRVTVDTPSIQFLTDDEVETLKERLRECMPLDTIITDLWDWDLNFEEDLIDDWYFAAIFGESDCIDGCADVLAEYFLKKCDEYGLDFNRDADPEWFDSHVLEQATEFLVSWRRTVVAKYGLAKM